MVLTMENKYSNIQNTKANIDDSIDWQNLQFSHPERTVRLATSFSGIGAIEHSFHRLGIKCQIQFAGDIDADGAGGLFRSVGRCAFGLPAALERPRERERAAAAAAPPC